MLLLYLNWKFHFSVWTIPVCMDIFYVCVQGRGDMCTGVHMQGEAQVLCSESSLVDLSYSIRQGFSVNPRDHQVAGIDSQLVLWCPVSASEAGITTVQPPCPLTICMDYVDLDFTSHICWVSALTTDLPLRPYNGCRTLCLAWWSYYYNNEETLAREGKWPVSSCRPAGGKVLVTTDHPQNQNSVP